MRIFKRVIAVFIVVLTAFLLVSKAKAASAVDLRPRGDKSDVHKYTDVNEFAEEYTYTTNLLDSYSVPKNGEKDYKIASIIPVQCFVEKGTHIHIGVKYGFYVYTNRDGSNSKNECEVFIFKITRSLNTNPSGVTKGQGENVTYATFTQFRPVISNQYKYKYNNGSYEITSKNSETDIAINYAFNLALSKNIAKYHNKENWTAVRALLSDGIKDELVLDCFRYGYRTLVDGMTIILKYIGAQINLKYSDKIFSVIKDVLIGGYDIIVSYSKGDCAALITTEITNTLASILSDVGIDTKANTIIKLATDVILELVDCSSGFPSLSSIFDTICTIMTSTIKSKGYNTVISNFSGLENCKSDFLSIVQDMGDFVLDAINFCVSVYQAGFTNSYNTSSNVFFGKNWCGYSSEKDMRVKAEKNNRISFFNVFEFNPNTISYDNYLDIYSELQFRNGSNNYKQIESTYKMKLFEDNKNNLLLDGPTTTNSTRTYSNVTISDGTDYRYVYVNPQINGTYTFSAKTDNGQVCSCGSTTTNGVYKISIYTGGVKGNHYINLDIKVVDNIKNLSTSFTCSKPGSYLITINNNYSDVYFEVTSVSYSQVYNFSSYSYTRTTYVTPTKVSNKQYKVTLESGKTYSISYKCNYNSSVSVVYTQ